MYFTLQDLYYLIIQGLVHLIMCVIMYQVYILNIYIIVLLTNEYYITGIDDLNAVFRTCKHFSKDWKFIGLELGIKKPTLDNIEKDCDDVKGMMLEMLTSWLRRESKEQPVPSWNILLTTLSEYDEVKTEQIASKFVCKHVK